MELGRAAQARLVGAAEAPIPETGSSDPDIVAGAIREVLDTLRVRRAQVVAGLSGQSAIVKRLSLPRMSDTELADALPWEAEQYVPFDLADVHLTYDRLPEAADQHDEEGDRGNSGAPHEQPKARRRSGHRLPPLVAAARGADGRAVPEFLISMR